MEPTPIDPTEVFLTDLIVHSDGSVRIQDYAETGEAEGFAEWVRQAIAEGLVIQPDLNTVVVTDAGRKRFAEIAAPVTHISSDGRVRMTMRRG
jgi:hypothetical protein